MSLNIEETLQDVLGKPDNPIASHHRLEVIPPNFKGSCWVPVKIWTMTKAEMERYGVGGQRCCFIVLLNKFGDPIYSTEAISISYGWNGSTTYKAPLEKQYPEPVANFVLGEGEYWVEVDDMDAAPYRVEGITMENPDDVDPHSHHCTLIVYQIKIPKLTHETLEPADKITRAKRLLQQAMDVLNEE